MENNKKHIHEHEGKNGSEQENPCEEKNLMISEADFNQLKQDAEKSQEWKDKFIRLQADFENARKRWDRDKIDILRFANDDLICSLLNIVDDLERSLELSQQKHEDFTAFLKGVEMIVAHLHDLLKKNGVEAIDAKGKIFDPNRHEALLQLENNEVAENTVLDVMQKGYTLNGKVIRTAKVQVSKKK